MTKFNSLARLKVLQNLFPFIAIIKQKKELLKTILLIISISKQKINTTIFHLLHL